MTKQSEFDIALIFSGKNRNEAEVLKKHLEAYGVSVFYDADRDNLRQLLAADLIEVFRELHLKRASRSVVIVSEHIIGNEWVEIELQAALERRATNDKYITTLHIDNTVLSDLPHTRGHINLRRKTLEEAAEELARIALADRYENLEWTSRSVPKHKLVLLENLTKADQVDWLCQKLYQCTKGEVKILAISAYDLVTDKQFQLTVRMLAERLKNDKCEVRVTFFVMDVSQTQLAEFSRLSKEPVESLREKFFKSMATLYSLFDGEIKQTIKVTVHCYSAIPTISLCCIQEEYIFKPYRIGGDNEQSDLFIVSEKQGRQNGFVTILNNMLNDLISRSPNQVININ